MKTLFQKPCLECGTVFDVHAGNQTTCSPRCKQKGERRRRAQRAGAAPTVVDHDDRIVGNIHGPTIADLDKAATVLRALASDRKGYLFTGTVPEWTPPSDIMFTRRDASQPYAMTYDPQAGAVREAEAALRAMYAAQPEIPSVSAAQRKLDLL